MGTKCLTAVYDDNSIPIIHLYRQHDGYPTWHGIELANFLSRVCLSNGVFHNDHENPSDPYSPIYCNGMEELAAKLVCYFKNDYPAGSIYLYPPSSLFDDYTYEYHVYPSSLTLLRSSSDDPLLFSGSWANFFVSFLPSCLQSSQSSPYKCMLVSAQIFQPSPSQASRK